MLASTATAVNPPVLLAPRLQWKTPTPATLDQLKTELIGIHLQPAFALDQRAGVNSPRSGHTAELAEALNQELSASGDNKRGTEIALWAFPVSRPAKKRGRVR